MLPHTECDMSQAVHDVIDERLRQQNKEGWTPEHDDTHARGELARAAAQYVILSAWPDEAERKVFEGENYMSVPFSASHLSGGMPIWPFSPEWLKPTTRRHDLVKAGALILAEIERLDRLS